MKKEIIPYMPVSLPEKIEIGPHKDQYAISYRDKHGLLQTSYPFVSSKIAWAFAMAEHAKHFKITLSSISLSSLKEGDLVLDEHYQVRQVIGIAVFHTNLFGERIFGAKSVFAKELPNYGMEVITTEAFKVPTDNEEFIK